jgi:hypothetical protein
MNNDNGSNKSDSSEFRESVLCQLATLNAVLPGLAKREDIGTIRLELATWKTEMNDSLHAVAASKSDKAVRKQHEICEKDMQSTVSNAINAHIKDMHDQKDNAPDPDVKKFKAFLAAIGPFLLKFILPALIGGGGFIGIQQIAKETQPVQHVAPAESE